MNILSGLTGKAPAHLKGKAKERWERKRDAEHTARNTGCGGCMQYGLLGFIMVIGIIVFISMIG